MKSVCIRSFSAPYFPAFGLNAERYGVSLRKLENTDQEKSEYEHFSRDAMVRSSWCTQNLALLKLIQLPFPGFYEMKKGVQIDIY